MPNRVRYVCSHCGGENVKWDAWASWDVEAQEMVLASTFDQAYCGDCEGETSAEEVDVVEGNSFPDKSYAEFAAEGGSKG